MMRLKSVARNYFFFTLPLLLLVSCQEAEPPVLRKIENVKIGEVIGDELYVSGDALIANPNSFKALLQTIDVEIRIDKTLIATVEEVTEYKILPNEDSAIPLKGKIDLKAVERIINQQGLKILMGEELPIRFTGTARAKVKGISLNIPIQFTDQINLKNIRL